MATTAANRDIDVTTRQILATRVQAALTMIQQKLGLTTVGLCVIVFALIGVAIGRAMENPGMTMAGYGLALVVLASLLVGRRKLAINARRSDLPSRVRPGQLIEAEVELSARQRVSTIILEEFLGPKLGQPVRMPVPVLPSNRTIAHGYTFSPQVRGIHDVGPLYAEWSDPFGLTRRRQLVAKATRIIVHPRTEGVLDRITSRAWEDPPIRPPVAKPWPSGFEFYALRDYVSGDDPRRISWRAVARYDKLLVRESEQGITDRVVMVLDTDEAYHSPGDPSETFEHSVSAIASLARKHIDDSLEVSLRVNGGDLDNGVRGRNRLIPLLDKLAALERSKEPLVTPLTQLCNERATMIHTVVVTPHLTQQAAGRLRLLSERGTSLLLVLVVWDDTDPATFHRAGSLGCNVIEVKAGMPLSRQFQQVVAGGLRR